MILSFKEFVFLREEATGSEAKPDEPKADYLDATFQELGIPIEAYIGTTITAPLDMLREKNLLFNQTIWLIPKQKIDQKSKYLQIQYFDANQTNPNFTRISYKSKDGKVKPYLGKIPDGTLFLISAKKFSQMLSLPFQAAVTSAASGAGPGGPGGLV